MDMSHYYSESRKQQSAASLKAEQRKMGSLNVHSAGVIKLNFLIRQCATQLELLNGGAFVHKTDREDGQQLHKCNEIIGTAKEWSWDLKPSLLHFIAMNWIGI